MLVAGLIVALNTLGTAPSVVDQATRIHLAQVDAPPPVPAATLDPAFSDQRTLYQLTREYQRLEAERPGLGFPIAFMIIGTAVLAVDGLLLIYAAVGLSALFIPPVYIVMGVIGLGFLVPGIIVLPFRLKKRGEIDQQLADLSALIRVREAQQPQGYPPPGYPQPGYYDAPPPPPPPPPPPAPTGMWPVPETSVALLAF